MKKLSQILDQQYNIFNTKNIYFLTLTNYGITSYNSNLLQAPSIAISVSPCSYYTFSNSSASTWHIWKWLIDKGFCEMTTSL